MSAELSIQNPRIRWKRAKSMAIATASGLWLLAVIGGMAVLANLSNMPSPTGKAPNQWPRESEIPLDKNRPTLLMFAHPRCPCTRASLGELELLLAQSGDELNAHVLFLQPPDVEAKWCQTDSWKRASGISGLTVHRDLGGVEARHFHADISGQVLLYAPNGRLVFEGGITISRGHSGDNPGRSAILALLQRKLHGQAATSVFGCSLFEVGDPKGGNSCKK